MIGGENVENDQLILDKTYGKKDNSNLSNWQKKIFRDVANGVSHIFWNSYKKHSSKYLREFKRITVWNTMFSHQDFAEGSDELHVECEDDEDSDEDWEKKEKFRDVYYDVSEDTAAIFWNTFQEYRDNWLYSFMTENEKMLEVLTNFIKNNDFEEIDRATTTVGPATVYSPKEEGSLFYALNKALKEDDEKNPPPERKKREKPTSMENMRSALVLSLKDYYEDLKWQSINGTATAEEVATYEESLENLEYGGDNEIQLFVEK